MESKKYLDTTHLSECVFFKRLKRGIPFYTLLCNGDILTPRLSDLKDNLCVFEDFEVLAAFLNKNGKKEVKLPKKVVVKTLLYKNYRIEEKRLWYPSIEKAFAADPTINFSFKDLQQLLRENEQLSLI